MNAVVGVIGAGIMGTGIAQVALSCGHQVILYHRRPEAADGARAEVARRLGEPALNRLTCTTLLTDLEPSTVVIESAAEEFDVKAELLTALEAVVPEDTVLATNTSSLSVTALAARLKFPGRFAGMHFFNPAPVMRLVEVVSGPHTSRATARSIQDLAAHWGKVPVHVASRPGFVVNRVARPFYGEALLTLEQGAADAATVDAVLTESGGFRMGPLALMDLIGHDVNEAVTREIWRAFHHDPRFTPSPVQRELVEAGHLGRKAGRGFYPYGPHAAPPRARTRDPLPAAATPHSLTAHGDLGPAAPLLASLAAAGVRVRTVEAPAGETAGALELPGGALLRLTDGRTATELAHRTGRPAVVFDLAYDYAAAPRIALASSGEADEVLDTCVALFQRLGKQVSVVGDIAGLIVFRTVAMLANLAADAVATGLADAEAVDLAMLYGAAHPEGPLARADRIGVDHVLRLLDNLARHHGDGRYRATPRLRRHALTGHPLHPPHPPHHPRKDQKA